MSILLTHQKSQIIVVQYTFNLDWISATLSEIFASKHRDQNNDVYFFKNLLQKFKLS